ncbi:hypothetical protein AB0J83_39230 [Actinoplanes sp. NPDC049596]|uniref:hypothetical protein n=1 Tax=unclassified Actinoplanes TaxID=2626549 RepID=UPI003449F5A3
MGYWGTIVVGWSARPLVEAGGMAGFGYRHRWLRELGDGWQMVETTGWDDPPDLRGSAAAVAASTGRPVLAAYVCDSDCLVMATDAGSLVHLPRPAEPCRVYCHGDVDLRSADEVVGELVAWADSGGLRADPARLRTDVPLADDLAFELVRALGVAEIGRTRPWAYPVDGIPFSMITNTLARRARMRAVDREHYGPEAGEVQPWEAPALALDADLWASLYDTDADVPSFVRRTAEVLDLFRPFRRPRPQDQENDEFLAPFLTGERPPFDTAASDRAWADRRAGAAPRTSRGAALPIRGSW